MLKYKQIWHGIKPTRWLIKFNLTKRKSDEQLPYILDKSISYKITYLGRDPNIKPVELIVHNQKMTIA